MLQQGTRVLLAGGGGFIASRLIPMLQERGVRLVIQELPQFCDRLQGLDVEIVRGGLGDAKTQEAINAWKPEVLFNLSGYTNQAHSRDNDDNQEQEHFAGARNLARAAFGPELKRWVQASTNEEYGHNQIPHREGMREMPVSAYSVAKVATTHYLQMLHQTQGCPAVCMRPFVVYGPGQTRGLVPFAVRAALENKEFETSEGIQCRDFVYVDDVARGFFLAGDTPGVDGEIINLGSGVETPVRELIETVCRLAGGGRPQFGAIPIREGEIMRMQASIEKADKLMGWAPQVHLEEGLSRMIAAAREVAKTA